MKKLYEFFRSSASYRLRIALNLKNISYEQVSIDFATKEQLSDDFTNINPSKLVPVLEEDDGWRLSQSLAIIEYLDETHLNFPLLPRDDPRARGYVRQCALIIACDIHPLNNLRILKYLTGDLDVDEDAKTAWISHWISEGFTALETLINEQQQALQFCFGDTPTLADCCLIPQVFNARRFNVNLSAFPQINRINSACLELDEFKRAHPDMVSQT